MKHYTYECDRCKVQAEHRHGWTVLPPLRFHMVDDNTEIPAYDLDLCPECTQSLQRWLKQEVVV